MVNNPLIADEPFNIQTISGRLFVRSIKTTHLSMREFASRRRSMKEDSSQIQKQRLVSRRTQTLKTPRQGKEWN